MMRKALLLANGRGSSTPIRNQPMQRKRNPYKVVKAYKADGTEIDRNKTYKAIINDFLYGGGDGFSVFRDTKLIGAINPDTEVFIQYIEDVE